MRFSLGSTRVAIFLVVLFSVLAYANVFSNEFVWDDNVFITDNPDVTSWRHAGHFFTSDVDGLYRPLRGALYISMYTAFGEQEFWYHLMSLVFHAGISVLVYLIARRLTGGSMVGLLVGVLFAVHPVHAERVINMTASFDMLGILFYLGAFWCYLLCKGAEGRQGTYLLVGAFGLFILGLLSSEEVATLPFVILLYEFAFHRGAFLGEIKSLRLWRYLSLFGILGAYLALRFGVLGIGGRMAEYIGGSFLATQMTMAVVYVKYLWLMVWPADLTLFYAVEPVSSFLELRFVGSLMLLLAVAFATVRYRQHSLVLFSIGWFFITLLPASNLVPLQVLMAERYLYLPSVGFLLLVAVGIDRFYRTLSHKEWGHLGKRVILFVLASVVVLSMVQTNARAAEWRDEVTLWEATIEDTPGSSRAYDNLGFAYERAGEAERAFTAFQKAVELDGQNYRALANLGVAYAQRNQTGKAIGYLTRSLEVNPAYHKTHDKLGLVYADIGQLGKAQEHLRRAIQLEPRYAKAHNDLGTVLGRQGQFEEAERHFRIALSLDEEYGEARQNLRILREFLESQG